MYIYYKSSPTKIILIFTIIFSSLFITVHPAFAAKKRVRTTAKRTVSGKKAIGISFSTAKLSRSTNSIILSLFNLDKAQSVEYSLSYATRGISQGVVGSIVPSGQASASRDLYFGTCSKGVCTPHYNITSGILTVTTTLINGTTNTKRYRFKKI